MDQVFGRFGAARRHADRAIHQTSPWVARLARAGYATKGVVYALIGALAAQVAVGRGGRLTDQRGALDVVAQTTFGDVLLGALGVGLVGYAAWKIVQALRDPEHKGRGAKGVVTRVGYAASGLLHASLGVGALAQATGNGRMGHTGGGAQAMTARVLAQPFGRWLVVAAGVGIVAFGALELTRAYRASFQKQLRTHAMSPRVRAWAIRSGRLGHAARGVVAAIAGVFLVRAALDFDPREARGLDGALRELALAPFGPVLLGVVAVGLVAYGVFMFVQARYRRIEPAA